MNKKLAYVVLTVVGGVSKQNKNIIKAYLQRTALCIFSKNPAELQRIAFITNKRQRELDDTQIRTSIKGT